MENNINNGIVNQQSKHYEDYEWPENNTGWFLGTTSMSGRWRRREFLAVAIPTAVIFSLIPNIIVLVVFCVVTIAVSAKRLHDMNLTSKYCFVLIAAWFLSYAIYAATSFGFSLAAIAGCIQILWYIILGIWPGSKGVNVYGSNPRRDYEEQCQEIGLPKISELK